MKILALVLFLLSACAATPHRVCSVTTIVDKGSTCTSIGRNLGPQASDVGIWIPTEGGSEWCISTLDPKSPLMCSWLVPSPAERAARNVRAQQEAQHPQGVPVPVPPTPLTPPPTPPKEAPKP